tara:strand:+ start:200 stop:412 length:213 start_codon:yes stop_codon:yes gene_type:complete
MDYRKIIIGSDLKNGFVYSIGQTVMGKYKIASFIDNGDRVKVYIENDKKEVQEWMDYPKSIVSFQENIDE